jgi:hypothetical protein
MRYAALTVPTALSALLLVATCILWVRSYTMTDDVYWYREDRMTRYRTSGGGLWFETRAWNLRGTPHTEWKRYAGKALYPFAASPTSPLHERLGFLANTTDYDLLFVAPYWGPALVLAPLPLFWARVTRRRWQRRWRRRRGLCTRCGYDLRASPAACPECGHPAAASPAAPPRVAGAIRGGVRDK